MWIPLMVVDIEDKIYRMNGCKKTGYREENIDDQNIIFLLEYESRV